MENKIINKENMKFLLPIIFILCGIYIRIHILLQNPSFSLDTCALANNLERTYLGLFKPLDFLQVAPPFFLVISKFVLNIFNFVDDIAKKDFILLLFPFLCSIVSLPLFLYLTNKIFKNNYINSVCTFLFAFNPCAINFAKEFKQYSCEMMFTLILLILFYNLDLKNITKKQLIFSSIILAISPWFSISSYFIILGGFCLILYNILKEKVLYKKNLFLLIIPFLISTLIFIFGFQIPVHKESYYNMQIFWADMTNGFLTTQNFVELFNQKLTLLEYLPDLHINMIYILLINVIILLFSKNNKAKILMLVPIVATIIASFLEYWPFETRLLLFLLPIFIMLFVQVLTVIKNNIILSILIYSVLVFFAVLNLKDLNNFYLINQYYTRELFEILHKENPKLDNIIADRIIYQHYTKQEPLLRDYMDFDFKESKFPDYMKKNPQDFYWFYVPFCNQGYTNDLIEYLKSNDYVITEEYISPTDNKTFIMKVEKQ